MAKTKGIAKTLRHGRVVSQALFLALTLWVAIAMLRGVSGATVERYCPFGGIETLLPWLRNTGTLCSLSTVNISMFFGVLALTLVFRRVFCSHICPMGAVFEWTGIFGRKYMVGKWKMPSLLDRALKWVKYPLLILILFSTWKVGELVFRSYDPYYVLFTAGKGHEVQPWSIALMAVVLVAAAAAPLFFCKYLCPLGACLAPLSKFGATKIRRDAEKCTNCGACEKACEWQVPIVKGEVVRSGECSNCLDCIRACPEEGALSLVIGRTKS